MSKIVFCVNHSYPHVGGCEQIVKKVSEYIASTHKDECIVISPTTKKKTYHNLVTYLPCPSSNYEFINLILTIKPDHIHTYSDYFVHWPTILMNITGDYPTKSIALVGMNRMQKETFLFNQFKQKHKEIDVIVHSNNYDDAKICKNLNIPINVIPNGVDLDEFKLNTVNFREKYNIKEENIILYVANFFPGKGHEYIPSILSKIDQSLIEKTRLVTISSSTNSKFDSLLKSNFKNLMKNSTVPYTFLENISREDTVAAFKSASVFLSPSIKEVGPIVIIESLAAGVPWISFPVGMVPEIKDGGCIINANNNYSGFIFDENISMKFASALNNVLNKNVEFIKPDLDKYDMNKISEQYYKIFKKEVNNGRN